MKGQISLYEYIQNNIEFMDDFEIIQQIERKTNFSLKLKKVWKDGNICHYNKYKEATISVYFGLDIKKRKYIGCRYDTKLSGCGMPCYSIEEAAETILNYMKFQESEV